MNRAKLQREISRKSKYTENPLTIKQAKQCLDLFQETVIDAVSEGEIVRLENFFKIEIKELKSRRIKNVYTDEYDYTRDLKIPRVKLSLNFVNKVKENLNEDINQF